MKKLAYILVFMTMLPLSMSAQEVFTEVRKSAQTTLDNPNSNDLLRQFSQFKIDALDYMALKMREQMPDSSVVYLDRQAYALNAFMTHYLKVLVDNRNEPAAYQVKLMKLFIDASVSNPLFDDSDKELVHSYFADGKSATRFSLDTDWQRARIAVASELKKIK